MELIATPDADDSDAVMTCDGGPDRVAWLIMHLGPGRPDASVQVVVTDSGLRIHVYPFDGEEDGIAGAIYVPDADLHSSSSH
jgi:hypothetical protein